MITKVKLTDFRNFKKREIDFSEKITVIVGHNAAGKTNILESLNLLSTGKSFKANKEIEMIQYNKSIAGIKGITSNEELEVKITTGENGWPKKRMMVNGVPRRMIDFASNFKTTLFAPNDLDLVTESPSVRRKFLDNVLSQSDREYRRAILSYEKGLRQRNKLLWRIREEGIPRSQLLFWNQLLIKNGDYISKKREEFVNFINNSGKINTNTTNNPMNTNFQLEYDRSVISEGRLEQYKNEEVRSATTLVGPHRDDFIFWEGKRNLASYGSRGEQRMGVLWIKMAELDYVEEILKAGAETSSARPTLLLDDIFSELDHEHRHIVMELAKRQQTIITTADEHFTEEFKTRDLQFTILEIN